MFVKNVIFLSIFINFSIYSENLVNLGRVYSALQKYSEAESIISQKPIESIYIKDLAQQILKEELAPGKILDTEKVFIGKQKVMFVKTGDSEFQLDNHKNTIAINAMFSTEKYLIPSTLRYIEEKYRKIPKYKPEIVDKKDIPKLKKRSTFKGKFLLVPLKSFHKKTFQLNKGRLNIFCKLLKIDKTE